MTYAAVGAVAFPFTLSSSTADFVVDGTAVVPDVQASGTFGVQWLAGDDDFAATIHATLSGQTFTTNAGCES